MEQEDEFQSPQPFSLDRSGLYCANSATCSILPATSSAKYARTEQKHLEGKEICLIFEKTSTRTRCDFEVACYDQGANVTYLDPAGSQIGHKESFKDAARVLGRMFDAIEYRGAAQTSVEELARYADVPVYNGLTDEYHPTQMIADVMTMREHSDKPINEIKYAYVGDTRSNMGHSLMILGSLLGMDVRICGTKTLWPSDEFRKIAEGPAKKSGARLLITEDTTAAARGNEHALAEERRYIKHNLNRMFREAYGPEIDKSSYEYRRAQELKTVLKNCDYFLDMHSAPTAQEPFLVAEPSAVDFYQSCRGHLSPDPDDARRHEDRRGSMLSRPQNRRLSLGQAERSGYN
jgi:ornithine carbamoyltransferase